MSLQRLSFSDSVSSLHIHILAAVALLFTTTLLAVTQANKVKQCYHTKADYGPCMSNESFKKSGCKYRTFPEHYKIENKETREEQVFIDYDCKNYYCCC
ncbi:MAG: hypothetical protein WBE68_16895 [Candidatus Nitrosopolaris sp.]